MKRQNINPYDYLALVDEQTDDKYICRSIDYSYYKYVKDEYVSKDTISIYQVCLVFPPIDKHIREFHLCDFDNNSKLGRTVDLRTLPRKARVITN